MEAGFELDHLIAEKIMGMGHALANAKDHTEYENLRRQPVPGYSTDIAYAWNVVETIANTKGMADTKLYVEVKCIYGNNWRAVIGGAQEIDIIGDASTAPHAICLAALQLVK